MTDAFEKAMQDIALKKGDPDSWDILNALKATNEDLDVTHQQTLDWHEKVIEKLDSHIADAVVRDQRIGSLEDWRRRNSAECAKKVEAAVAPLLASQVDNHRAFHNQHMLDFHPVPRRMDDPPDSEFTEKRESAFPVTVVDEKTLLDMTTGWRMGRWLLMLAVVALVGWGLPFWADSCASRNAEKSASSDTHGLIAPASSSPYPATAP